MGIDFRLEERDACVRPVRLAPRLELEVEGRRVVATLEPGSSRGEAFLVLDGRSERVFVASRHDAHFIHWRGRVHRVDAINALDRAREQASRAGGAEELRAPMPGVVVAVAVQAGDVVEAGALLLTIESMKLQTAITATHPAQVAEVCVAAGDHFDQGAALVRLAAPDTVSPDAPPRKRSDATPAPKPSPAAGSKGKSKATSKTKPASKPKKKGRRA